MKEIDTEPEEEMTPTPKAPTKTPSIDDLGEGADTLPEPTKAPT